MVNPEHSAHLEECAGRALELMQQYVGGDEADDAFATDSGGVNKESFDSLLHIRKAMKRTWDNIQKEEKEDKTRIKVPRQANTDDLQTSYVDTMTDAFADSLEALRQQQEEAGKEVDVDILVEAMKSGIDLLNPEEKQFFLQELEMDTQSEQDEPFHLQRRRELGYDVSP